MPVAEGKVETKIHMPKRAYAYIKKHATERGMGQFMLELVACHEKQSGLTQRIVSIEDKLAKLIDYIETGEVQP